MSQLVIGLGEIGKPLFNLLSRTDDAVYGRDLEDDNVPSSPDVMHICFPYCDLFVDWVVEYVNQYDPQELIVIHSTVVPGTTREIAKETAHLWPIAYSPVRGRHGSMEADLLKYHKFVAEATATGVSRAIEVFQRAGMKPVEFRSNVEGLELAKLLETSYSAVLISWAQEMSRYCAEVEADYLAVNSFFVEVPWHPGYIFRPGVIGGHCLLPNLNLLETIQSSVFIDAIRQTNEIFALEGGTTERMTPLTVDEVRREYLGD